MNLETHDGLPPLPPADGEIAQVRYWNISAMKDYARAAVESAAAPQPAQAALSDEQIQAVDQAAQLLDEAEQFAHANVLRAILAASQQPAEAPVHDPNNPEDTTYTN